MFSNQKNKWNLGVKSNFENFEFWVVPISKSALVTTTVHQFQKLGLVLCMVFNQEFEFCVQTFFTSLLKNSIFIHSEARLSSIMQNWKKLLSFHYCLPKGVTNFECLLLNLHILNYHNRGVCNSKSLCRHLLCDVIEMEDLTPAGETSSLYPSIAHWYRKV